MSALCAVYRYPLPDGCPECGGKLYLKSPSQFPGPEKKDTAKCQDCGKEYEY